MRVSPAETSNSMNARILHDGPWSVTAARLHLTRKVPARIGRPAPRMRTAPRRWPRRRLASPAPPRRLRHAADQRRQDRFERARARPREPAGQDRVSSTPSPEQTGVRLLPLGAYSLDTRIQLAQRAPRSLDVQYYVLENDPTGRLLMRRCATRRCAACACGCWSTTSTRPHRSAAARPGGVPERRGAPVQPVLLRPLRRRRRPLHGVDLRLRPAQPPHAQQALHRRRRDGGGRRAQHRRRIFPARAWTRTSSTWTRSSMGAVVQLDGGHLRPLLEQRGRLSRSRRSASRSATRRRAPRRSTRSSQPAAVAADRAARDRPARLRPARRGARRRPARPRVGHRPRLRRPARKAARDVAARSPSR